MVTSTSIPIGQKLYCDPFFFVKREIFYFCVIFFLSYFLLRIPMVFWEKNSHVILIISFFLLIVVLIFGKANHGAFRWINIGFFHIQPSELCKISSCFYVSNYLSRKYCEVQNNFWSVFKPISVIILQSFLLLAEPDLGTIIVVFFTILSILFISGIKIEQFIIVIISSIATIILLILTEPYRVKRILSFWHPWNDPFGAGYQITQSLIALGRGSFFGQGLGNSIQKLYYLPDAHSDFIFSIIGEELGFIGAFFTLLMIFLLSLRAIYIGKTALKKHEIFSGFLACSIGMWFILQTSINISGIIGIIPVKGLTLPLISYGGSSLIINSIAILILLRIDFEIKIKTSQAFFKGI